jgi:hypothetical protein
MLNISDQEHVLQKNTIAAQLEPIEIDMIEECHNINAVNCNVQRETIQWPEHIKTIFDNNNKPCFSTNLVTGSTRPVIPLTIGSIALPATMVSLDVVLNQKFLNTIDPSLKPEILPVNIKMKTATGEI